MEELIYIVLVVIWLLVSFLRRKPKGSKPAEKPKPASQEETAPSGGDEVNMEEMLEDFFGGGKKKKEEKQPEKEPVYEAGERRERRDRYGHEDRREREWSERQLADKEHSPVDEQEKGEGAFEEFEGQTGVSEDFEFVSDGKVQTIEELIQSHKKEEAMRLAMEEEDADYQSSEEIPEFDLRTAVIFSEILNRKYH